MNRMRDILRKGVVKRVWGAVYADRRAFLKNLLLLNLLGLSLWLFWGVRFSLFSKMGPLLHASPDSATYEAVCDWIYGQGPATVHTLHRTFLYPLLLGIKLIAGNFGIWLLQSVLLLVATNLLALTIHKLSGRRLFVQAAFVTLAVYPTFFFMTFRILTEILVVFFLCLWLFCSVNAMKKNKLTDPSAFLLVFIAGMLSVTKPVFLLFFILLAFTILVIKPGPRRLLLVILASLPVVCQVGINAHLHGRIVFSAKGTSALNSSFLPQLLADVRYNQDHPGAGGPSRLTHAQKDALSLEVLSWPAKKRSAFLFRHWPQAAKKFFFNIFQENMTQGFGEIPGPFFYYGTKLFNIGALILHVYMLPVIVFVLLWRIGPPAERIWLWLNVCLFLLLVLATGTVYWQGERYVFIMCPLWITIYVHALALLKGKISLSR
jgi:hypothetical protein